MKKISFITAVFFVLFSYGQKGKRISYPEVINRLTDLKALACLPEAGEASAMWSSYDRESKINPVTGEFTNWGANIDGFEPQYIRKEGNNEVLAEMKGPGAIVRIWSASPKKGKVKIYIDGEEKPVLDLAFADYFKPRIAAFDFPELVYETHAKGFNNYVPITYRRSCKIVAEPGWGQYYHFNYISFPDGTEVERFRPRPDNAGLEALNRVNRFFSEDMGNSPYTSDFQTAEEREEILTGEEKQIFKLDGAGAISSFRVRVRDTTGMEEMLRKVVLKMKWDGEDEASVWSPLGDFFGTSPGWNTYKTLPMGMAGGWMYSYWYMPFSNGAEIVVHNEYDEDVEIEFQVSYEKLGKEAEELGRFHAKWHRNIMPPGKDRWPDWTLLKTTGKGRFVGTHLLVWNPKGGSCTLAGPGHYWWGEGDEKFFVDGEKFPSVFGTGTEDYFGYAWCDPSRFERAFHSQTQDNDNMGYQPVNRWHITDNIPFRKSFDGYLEKYFPDHWPTQYATVVYWYLEPGGYDPIGETPVEERYGYEIPYDVYREEGVIEGENLKIDKNTGGWASTDVWAHEDLFREVSGHKIITWNADPDKENRLTAGFEWDEGGRYSIEANIIKTGNGGRFSITLNGNNLQEMDFKTEREGPATEKLWLGVVDIEPGTQNLEINWIGEKEEGKNLSIDYISFKRVK